MYKEMIAAIRPSVMMTLLFALLVGLIYPALLTGLGALVVPAQAGGSLISRDGHVIGSELIGQNFTAPRYFHGRPSAAGKGYDATNSGGSNLGPTSKPLVDRIKSDQVAFRRGSAAPIPADLLTTSASGLDPHISPEAARYQIARVAAARGLAPAAIEALVAAHTEGALLGFIGEPRVNVLLLNLALDRLAHSGAKAGG